MLLDTVASKYRYESNSEDIHVRAILLAYSLTGKYSWPQIHNENLKSIIRAFSAAQVGSKCALDAKP